MKAQSHFMFIGVCSLCGGPVTVPKASHSVVDPVPECLNCGARKKHTGRIIDMVRNGT